MKITPMSKPKRILQAAPVYTQEEKDNPFFCQRMNGRVSEEGASEVQENSFRVDFCGCYSCRASSFSNFLALRYKRGQEACIADHAKLKKECDAVRVWSMFDAAKEMGCKGPAAQFALIDYIHARKEVYGKYGKKICKECVISHMKYINSDMMNCDKMLGILNVKPEVFDDIYNFDCSIMYSPGNEPGRKDMITEFPE